jgi:tRNA pseudouridine55 synthase
VDSQDKPQLEGYLNVLKPPGWTSHDVVGKLRRLLNTRRIGHAGTLDPAAIGVLPVAVGRATRTLSSPVWDVKEYLADVRFGWATDTDDAGGQRIAAGEPEGVTVEAIKSCLTPFTGEIRQRPPAYSAVHVGGERAYRRARRGELEPLAARVVHIDRLGLVRWSPPLATLHVECRSGTYVRSIARDLGTAVGCPAHLASLVRLRVGPFTIRAAADPGRLAEEIAAGGEEAVLWPPDVATAHLPAIVVDDEQGANVAYGRDWPVAPNVAGEEGQMVRVYARSGTLLSLATRRADGWHPSSGLGPAGMT